MKFQFCVLAVLFLCVSCYNNKDSIVPLPIDTIIKYDMEDGSQKELKKAWLKKIHQAEEGIDWEQIETATMLKKNRYKKDESKSGDREVIVEGVVEGKWQERGSRNQAGNVLATTYNKYTDELYTVSASGIIWKGTGLGENWQAQNEFLRFDNRFLVGYFSEDNARLVSSIRGKPYYSDDMGVSWIESQGIPAGSVSISKWELTGETNKLFIFHKPGHWDELSLYLSADMGQSFTLLQTFGTNDLNNFGICSPHHTDDFFVMEQIAEKKSKIHKWVDSLENISLITDESPLAFGEAGRGNLIGAMSDTITSLYVYDADNNFLRSQDEGISWEKLSTLPTRPWNVGVFMSSSNPENMIYGEVNSYRSLDGGQTWHLINEWYEYYNDPVRELHADIMYIEEFETIDGDPFILISNHGGINRTDDGSFNNYNISTDGLNVSQYYSVRTFPFDHSVVFAGSQDQGFQRGTINIEEDEIAVLDQPISGDYGHIVFTQVGLGMWMVYPGGWVSYYDNPVWGGIVGNYTLESVDESVWIPPIVPSPVLSEPAVYMAGGNIDGGSGSYLIKLTYDPINGITPTQYDYNFLNGGDKIASIAFNHFDPNIIYIGGQNGSFFISEDGGEFFEKIWISVPGAHYLYGSCIYPSKLDPNVVYISGSGYSNSPVIKSIDGGRSFSAMNEGLPPTLVFNIVANEDESLFFAASEAGPYVFVSEKNQWYDLSGTSAPSNTYWSVEYLNEERIARFGTYGRGIWDFRLDELNVSSTFENAAFNIQIYPNPASDFLNLNLDFQVEEYIIYDLQGRKVSSSAFESTINIGHLKSGTYLIQLKGEKIIGSARFYKI